MSRTFRRGERRLRVQGVRRQPADLRKLARALIQLAQAEAEAAAQAQAKAAPGTQDQDPVPSAKSEPAGEDAA